MAQSINLIPQKEVKEQTKTKVVKFSTILTIVLLVVVSVASAYFLYETRDLKSQISTVDSEIEKLRGQIIELSSIEVTARNLDKKYGVLQDLFDTRLYYSDLLKEVAARSPGGVTFKSLSLRGSDEINISGKATDYITISDFTGRLLEETSDEGILENPFSLVTLNSVSLDSQDSTVNFAITVIMNQEAFQK